MNDEHARDGTDRVHESNRTVGLALLERLGIKHYVTIRTEGTDPATWWPSGVKPGQLPFVGFNNTSLLVDDKNGLTVHCYNGTTSCIRLDGWVEVSMPRIGRVEIRDSTRIVSCVIAHVHDTTSHTITFKGGGVLGYVIARDGKVIELTHRDVMFAHCPTEDLVVVGTCFPKDRFRRDGSRPDLP